MGPGPKTWPGINGDQSGAELLGIQPLSATPAHGAAEAKARRRRTNALFYRRPASCTILEPASPAAHGAVPSNVCRRVRCCWNLDEQSGSATYPRSGQLRRGDRHGLNAARIGCQPEAGSSTLFRTSTNLKTPALAMRQAWMRLGCGRLAYLPTPSKAIARTGPGGASREGSIVAFQQPQFARKAPRRLAGIRATVSDLTLVASCWVQAGFGGIDRRHPPKSPRPVAPPGWLGGRAIHFRRGRQGPDGF